MPTLYELLPDVDALLALEPEQLAAYLLEHLNSLSTVDQQRLNRYNFHHPDTVQQYPPARHNEILGALMEAWVWLEREGLLAPKPMNQGEWVMITRRGKTLTGRAAVDAFRRNRLLPRNQLHPKISAAVSAEFLAGRYDTAVFNAFREIEIAVRAASGLENEYGDKLMREAFHPDRGRLTDLEAPPGERVALANLFAGAFGALRNPNAHAHTDTEPAQAVEAIVFSSLLMRIADARAEARKGAPG